MKGDGGEYRVSKDGEGGTWIRVEGLAWVLILIVPAVEIARGSCIGRRVDSCGGWLV